jgi:hypothetical protein
MEHFEFLVINYEARENLIEDIHMEGLMAISHMQGGFKYQVLHYEWSM